MYQYFKKWANKLVIMHGLFNPNNNQSPRQPCIECSRPDFKLVQHQNRAPQMLSPSAAQYGQKVPHQAPYTLTVTLGLHNQVQLLYTLDCALNLRYLGLGTSLNNLVHDLAVPSQRVLAEWVPRKISFCEMAATQNHVIINGHVSLLHLLRKRNFVLINVRWSFW